MYSLRIYLEILVKNKVVKFSIFTVLEESPNYVISMNVRSMNEPEDVPSMLLKLTYPADYPETSPLQIVRSKRHNKLLLNDNIKFSRNMTMNLKIMRQKIILN